MSGLDTPILQTRPQAASANHNSHNHNSNDNINSSSLLLNGDNSMSSTRKPSITRSSDAAVKERLLSAVTSNMNEEYFYGVGSGLEDSRIRWTVADQLKLLALDSLQKRMLEFHNNVHIRGEDISNILSKDITGTKFDLDNRSHKSDKSDKFSDKSLNDSISSHSQLVKANRLKVSDALLNNTSIYSNNSKSSRPLNEATLKMNEDLYSTADTSQKSKIIAGSKDTKLHFSGMNGADFERDDVMAEYGCVAIKFIPDTENETYPIRLRKQDLESFINSADLHKKAKKEGEFFPNDGGGGGEATISSNNPFIWFHLTDLSYLSEFSKRFNIHELCVASFYDFRANSTFMSTQNSCVFSFCAFHLKMVDAELNKLVIYCQDGLIITFESSIMVDLEENIGTRFEKESNRNKNHNSPPAYESVIFERILEKLHRISSKARELGIMYIAYQLALECLYIQDSILEFLSRSLAFVKQEISSNLTYKQKLDLLHKMQSILNSSHLLHQNHQKYKKVLSILTDASAKTINSGKIASALSTYLVKDSHFIYIQDLVEAFEFSDDCIQSIVEALKESRIALDAIITLRTSNTSIFLSLVATTFLPLTFFAGVFGMNFSENGDYSISILNNSNGPNVFVGICVGSVVLILIYFISQGWIEVFIPNCIAKLLNKQSYSIDAIERELTTKEIEEAKMEELKRNYKSNLLKSLQKSPVVVRETIRGSSKLRATPFQNKTGQISSTVSPANSNNK